MVTLLIRSRFFACVIQISDLFVASDLIFNDFCNRLLKTADFANPILKEVVESILCPSATRSCFLRWLCQNQSNGALNRAWKGAWSWDRCTKHRKYMYSDTEQRTGTERSRPRLGLRDSKGFLCNAHGRVPQESNFGTLQLIFVLKYTQAYNPWMKLQWIFLSFRVLMNGLVRYQ